MNRNFRWEAICIMIGLFLVGFLIGNGIKSMSENARTVNVKGLAEMEVKANKVTWPLVVKFVGNDLTSLYDEVNRSNAIVKKFLLEKGIPENEITENAPQIVDKAAEVYNNGYTTRYNVTSVLTVVTDKVDLVRKLMTQQGELLKQGVAVSANDYQNMVIFEFTGLNEVKPKMIEEATRNARAAAEKFASDSNSDLGKIKNANQGQFSIEDRDANTPFIKRIRVVTTINYFLKD